MQGILHYFIGKIDYETELPSAYAVANYKKSLEFLEAFKICYTIVIALAQFKNIHYHVHRILNFEFYSYNILTFSS